MTHLDASMTILLCSAFFYATASLYVIGMVLRPLLTTAINGLLDLARLAVGRADNQSE